MQKPEEKPTPTAFLKVSPTRCATPLNTGRVFEQTYVLGGLLSPTTPGCQLHATCHLSLISYCVSQHLARTPTLLIGLAAVDANDLVVEGRTYGSKIKQRPTTHMVYSAIKSRRCPLLKAISNGGGKRVFILGRISRDTLKIEHRD